MQIRRVYYVPVNYGMRFSGPVTLQPSRRIHLRIGVSVLETCKPHRRLTTRLCRSIHSVCDGRAGGDE
jgi:hypothetical protein